MSYASKHPVYIIAGLSDRIRDAAKARDLPLSQLARDIHISRGTMDRIVGRDAAPNAAILKAICLRLDVSADWLLGIDELPSMPIGASVYEYPGNELYHEPIDTPPIQVLKS